MGHKLDKVGGKAKKSLSSLKLSKDKKNLDSVPEGRELGGILLRGGCEGGGPGCARAPKTPL